MSVHAWLLTALIAAWVACAILLCRSDVHNPRNDDENQDAERERDPGDMARAA